MDKVTLGSLLGGATGIAAGCAGVLIACGEQGGAAVALSLTILFGLAAYANVRRS